MAAVFPNGDVKVDDLVLLNKPAKLDFQANELTKADTLVLELAVHNEQAKLKEHVKLYNPGLLNEQVKPKEQAVKLTAAQLARFEALAKELEKESGLKIQVSITTLGDSDLPPTVVAVNNLRARPIEVQASPGYAEIGGEHKSIEALQLLISELCTKEAYAIVDEHETLYHCLSCKTTKTLKMGMYVGTFVCLKCRKMWSTDALNKWHGVGVEFAKGTSVRRGEEIIGRVTLK